MKARFPNIPSLARPRCCVPTVGNRVNCRLRNAATGPGQRSQSVSYCDFILDIGNSDPDGGAISRLALDTQFAPQRVCPFAHAAATEVKLSLYRDAANSLILEVRDNGKGLTPEDRRKAASFGLIGMRERAYALGGEFKIESQPGNGTTIRVTIPNIGNETPI